MALLSDDLRARLEENGRRQHAVKGTENEVDFAPVAKLHTPLGDAVWLLTEIDPQNVDKAFGLHGSGKGPEPADRPLCARFLMIARPRSPRFLG